jgi:hypothetical protein
LPELITETLLVTAPFKDRGTDYVPGDRVPVRHRRIRQIARENPQWFRMEFETAEIDLELLAKLDAEFESKYRTMKQAREEEKIRRKRALRRELEEQDIPDHELEKRFAAQEREREKGEREMKEEREREKVERDIAIAGDQHRSGFHF